MSAKRTEPSREDRDWILVGTDFSQPAAKALQEACALARARGADLLLVHVIETDGLAEIAAITGQSQDELRRKLELERRQHLAAAADLARHEAGGAGVEAVIGWGHPFEQILRKATEFAVDLIVLGAAGRGADLQRVLFGSTAERVLRAAPCAVLCVPAPR